MRTRLLAARPTPGRNLELLDAGEDGRDHGARGVRGELEGVGGGADHGVGVLALGGGLGGREDGSLGGDGDRGWALGHEAQRGERGVEPGGEARGQVSGPSGTRRG